MRKIRPVHCAAVLLALCAHWAPAQAQNVYRCGGSYSNQPCPGGIVVPTDDPRSAGQRAQTEAATRRDATSAQVMEKERLKQEGVAAQATIPATGQPDPAETERTASSARPKKPELFTAVSPKKPGDASVKKKRKKTAKKAA